jgi:hypothetical protein
VRFPDDYLNVEICDPEIWPQPLPAPVREKKMPKPSPERKPSSWMEGFNLQKALLVWKVIKEETGGWIPDQGP